MARKLLKTNDSARLFAETHPAPMQVGTYAGGELGALEEGLGS